MKKQYNLQPLKKNKLKHGDIFAVLINENYIFGRIIYDNLTFENSPFGGSNLIYIYNVLSPNLAVDNDSLTPDNLLIPPLFISNMLWSRGYSEKVDHSDITADVLLKQHCFFSALLNTYVDERGNALTSKSEPCGEWTYVVGLDYFDNLISDALGIDRAPLTEDGIFYISGRGEKIWYKKSRAELKKYRNYAEIIEKYPEVVE